MQEHSSGKLSVDDFAPGGSFFQQINQDQTGKIVGFFFVSGIFEGDLADGRYKLSQRSIDPVTATVCFHVDYPFTQKARLIVTRFAPRLTGDVLIPFMASARSQHDTEHYCPVHDSCEFRHQTLLRKSAFCHYKCSWAKLNLHQTRIAAAGCAYHRSQGQN
jgi:hypothetical protein